MALTHVLVVDDNDMFSELAKFVLNQAGHAVDTASNAATALSGITVFRSYLVLKEEVAPVVRTERRL